MTGGIGEENKLKWLSFEHVKVSLKIIHHLKGGKMAFAKEPVETVTRIQQKLTTF